MMFPSNARVVSLSVTLEAASSALARGVSVSFGVSASLKYWMGVDGASVINSTSTASPSL